MPASEPPHEIQPGPGCCLLCRASGPHLVAVSKVVGQHRRAGPGMKKEKTAGRGAGGNSWLPSWAWALPRPGCCCSPLKLLPARRCYAAQMCSQFVCAGWVREDKTIFVPRSSMWFWNYFCIFFLSAYEKIWGVFSVVLMLSKFSNSHKSLYIIYFFQKLQNT